MMSVLDQEIRMINHIDQFKTRTYEEAIALFVSLAIACGQILANYISEKYF